ncbi:MAG: UDP-3-O-(3-hydroxymyristoyl)glucosamine N-acyltransferase [Mariprofundaceae bacterium]
MITATVAELANLLSGTLENAAPDLVITGVETLETASASHASFFSNARYKQAFQKSKAGLILISEEAHSEVDAAPLLRVKSPYLAFAHLQRHFHPEAISIGQRHPTAQIAATSTVADNVDLGAYVTIGEHVTVGQGCRIAPGVIIEDHVVIGESCLLHSRAVIQQGSVLGDRVIIQAGAVIGSDGFGYAWSGSEHLKIPQVGCVIIENDVEIGANSCIDRGAIGNTVIEQGCKLDNMVQIAHNVRVGAFSVMAAQVGISGSTVIGQGCQFGGQAGAAGHLEIGAGSRLSGKAGVVGDLAGNETYAGFPAIPHRTWLRASVMFSRLPQLWHRLLRSKNH